MKRLSCLCLAACFLICHSGMARAHFGMVIPSESTVMEQKDAALQLSLKFWHPFENIGMHLEKPAEFSVYHDGKKTDLLPALKKGMEQDMTVWTGEYAVKRPGLYTFVMEPHPYYEKEEDCLIIHLTKVCVDAFGDDDGWDEPLGLKAEIVPLSRPGALYAGNVFQGRVLQNGKPVPHAEVEVEWFPGTAAKGVAPHDGLITQTVKADDAGVFTYAAPLPGWWGFAALLKGETKPVFEGEEKDVELGAVFWARFHELPATVPAAPAQ